MSIQDYVEAALRWILAAWEFCLTILGKVAQACLVAFNWLSLHGLEYVANAGTVIEVLLVTLFAAVIGSAFAISLILFPFAKLVLWHAKVDSDTPDEVRVARLNTRLRRWSWIIHSTFFGIIGFFILFGIVIPIGAFFVKGLIGGVLYFQASYWFVPFGIAVAYVLYALRNNLRSIYGLLEVVVGVAALWYSVGATADTTLAHLIANLGGIYIMVRGFDNFDSGLGRLLLLLPPQWADSLQKSWSVYFRWDLAFWDGLMKSVAEENMVANIEQKGGNRGDQAN